MPCQSYGDDPVYTDPSEKKLRDRLARIACRALTHIEETDPAGLTAVVLRDQETADWWHEHKIADAKQKEKERAVIEKKRMIEERKAKKREILSRLSEEDRAILGMK